MENLKALVYGRQLNNYQRGLAIQEFEKLQQSNKDANEFIIDIANLLKIETDGIGYDDLKLSLDDFQEAIKELKK